MATPRKPNERVQISPELAPYVKEIADLMGTTNQRAVIDTLIIQELHILKEMRETNRLPEHEIRKSFAGRLRWAGHMLAKLKEARK